MPNIVELQIFMETCPFGFTIGGGNGHEAMWLQPHLSAHAIAFIFYLSCLSIIAPPGLTIPSSTNINGFYIPRL